MDVPKEQSEDTPCLYECGACGLMYREQEWADKCEGWCRVHDSCNLEITAHSVDLPLGEVKKQV